MPGFRRGGTPTFTFKIPSSIDISSLGEPTIALTQNLIYIELEPIVDTTNNTVSGVLPALDSLRFVAGVTAKAQVVFKDVVNDEDKVYPFTTHEFDIYESLTEVVFETPDIGDDTDDTGETGDTGDTGDEGELEE